MKKMFISLALTSLFSMAAHAEFNIFTCDSVQGTTNSLILVVNDSVLKQVRTGTNGVGTRAFIPTKLQTQNVEGVTLYTLSGVAGLLQVENQVLAGDHGYVVFSNNTFSCN